jgi:hypothetical protein
LDDFKLLWHKSVPMPEQYIINVMLPFAHISPRILRMLCCTFGNDPLDVLRTLPRMRGRSLHKKHRTL